MYKEEDYIIEEVERDINYAEIEITSSYDDHVGLIVRFYDEDEADALSSRLRQDINDIASSYDWYEEIEDKGRAIFWVDIYPLNY